VFSPDGQWVVFETRAPDLEHVLAPVGRRVMAWRVATGEMRRLTLNDAPRFRNYPGPYPIAVFSPDGRFVAVTDNPDDGGPALGMLHEFSSGQLTQLGSNMVVSAISVNGAKVGYRSAASTFSDVDQAWVKDRVAGTNLLVSAGPAGEAGNGPSGAPQLSADGRFAVFSSAADNLVEGDDNGAPDIFVRDLLLGSMVRIGGWRWSGEPLVALNGGTVLFASVADDLTAGDLNGENDLFLLELPGVESEFRLTIIRHPATFSVTLAWPARAGRNYSVEASVEADSGWETQPAVVRIEGEQAIFDEIQPGASPRRFYRVREQ
jgi:Tol biopolymer transport system component